MRFVFGTLYSFHWMKIMTRSIAKSPAWSRSMPYIGRSLIFLIMVLSSQMFLPCASVFAESPVLTWDANGDADYYQVYMRARGESEYTLVSGQIPAGTTSFRLMPAPGNEIHYFSVKAFNNYGNSSDFSDEIETPNIPYDPINPTPVTKPDSGSGTLPQPLDLEIIIPEDGAFAIAGNIIELSANVFKGDILRTDYMVTWTSSIDGYLGTGLDIGATLSEGVHIIMATSTDEGGDTASASIILYVQRINTPPSVGITDSAAGVSGSMGQAFTFKGAGTDEQDGDLSQNIVWSSSRDGQLGTGSSIQVTLSPGEHVITAQVTDSKGVTATTSVTVTSVAYNAPPVMAVLEIRKGESTEAGMVADIYGSASDLEDGDLSDRISWSSSLSGTLGKGAHIKVTLPAGVHTITGTVLDSAGKEGKDALSVTAPPYNYPPALNLSCKLTGSPGTNGQSCELSGTATDKEDGDISASIVWSSSLSGRLGSGAMLTVTLASGDHVITGTVTDSQGKTTSSEIRVNVGVYNNPPVITPGTHQAGTLDKDGQDYTFNATATDIEDGSISAYITWNSDIDGYLGTGPTIMTRLSSGEHVVTAGVTDSQGETASKTFEINVGVFNTAPTLVLGSFTENGGDLSGTVYSFTAGASDEEDGNISAFITWNSDRDGYLGTGPSITTSLSPGAHTITASVNDSLGKTASKTRVITVSAINTAPTVAITGVVPGVLDAGGQGYGFTGSAMDKEDGNISASILWSSDKDGSLGVGASIRTTLSSGVHTITALSSDSQGKTTSTTTQVTVAAYNTAPVLAFNTASPGTLDQDGQDYTFSGTAADTEDGDLGSSITWTSTKDGYLGKGVLIQVTLSSGSHIITASVSDSKGKTATAVRQITVNVYNFPPEISINSAEAGTTGPKGQSFTFTGSASDREDGNLGSSITWTSSISGYLGSGTTLTATLSPGVHVIRASITDSQSKTAGATRSVTAVSYNNPPVVTIKSVAQGVLSDAGQSCTFTGTATDTEDGAISSAILWSSSLSGSLGTGSSLTRTLSTGQHVITAKITDSGGKTSETSRNITVAAFNALPVVTAISHLKGPSTLKGQAYTFSSSAGDKEDGDLSASIIWSSNITGQLGKGASIQTVLSAGAHVITARVKDSKGQEGTATKTLSVVWANMVPSVQILEVTPGAAGKTGQIHEFSGTAVDEEEGNLSGSIKWTSSIDGNLGKGNAVMSTLRPGTHTITATACDSKGDCASATRQVTVAAFNSPPDLGIVSVIGTVQDTKGQVFELTAKATDEEEGTLSGRIAWTSSMDGNLGQGASIKPRLSSGTHTITARVKDGKGKEAARTITVTARKAAKLELKVVTKKLYRFKLVTVSWKGGSSDVVIYRDNKKIGTGPSEGKRYYWITTKSRFRVCDSLSSSCSATYSTK